MLNPLICVVGVRQPSLNGSRSSSMMMMRSASAPATGEGSARPRPSPTEQDLHKFDRRLPRLRIRQRPEVEDGLGIARDLVGNRVGEIGVSMSFRLDPMVPGGRGDGQRHELLAIKERDELLEDIGPEGLHIPPEFEVGAGERRVVLEHVVVEQIGEVEAPLGGIRRGQGPQDGDGGAELRADVQGLLHRFDQHGDGHVPAIMGEDVVVGQAVEGRTRPAQVPVPRRFPILEIHGDGETREGEDGESLKTHGEGAKAELGMDACD